MSEQRLWLPRHWPIWIGFGVLRLLTTLPYAWQRHIGTVLGRLFYCVAGKRRRIAVINLKHCFPQRNERTRRRLVIRHFESLGIAILEMGCSWWAPSRTLRRLVTVTGRENLDAALGQGNGVILWGAHFTTMEIALRLLSCTQPCHMTYRRHRNPVIEHMLLTGRGRHPGRMLPRDDVRGVYRALSEKRVVWMAPDQYHRKGRRLLVDFFSQPAWTIIAPLRFARHTGAAVVPFFHHRQPDGGYELILQPALEEFPSSDACADLQRVHALMQAEIERSPEQYLWVHRRFKDRAGRGDDIYAAG